MAEDPVWKRRILEPPRVERVERDRGAGDHLEDPRHGPRASEQWAAGGEFRKLLLEAFTKNGIQLPRPPTVVIAHPEATPAAVRWSARRRRRTTSPTSSAFPCHVGRPA